ncbi:70 kDa peptidyl-prolyl isomerase-like [Mangifera indica]|uniref:70 kDa peptidyl-prolyl isomerase-like n=1 Tax=Mangifera indica TaxID=29780 RepID=UPI001CFA0C18|nr:70 kDa peptidyl-prolyl isomerase-like [Mangifera indica]
MAISISSSKSHLNNETKTINSESLEREIGDQGLRKQILKRGTSWQTPFPGDEVEVHFSGHVDGGACLDLSHDEETPFRFKLGQGEVIKGWDEGVATMKKGERAILIIPPSLAYGEAGSPPLIPPNSTLVFNIELLSWTTIRDITGDGGILKKVIKEGEGWATPRDNDEVFVKYEAWLENGTLTSESKEGVEFQINDGYLCPAMSKAVKTMRKGEKAELAVKFSYGFIEDGYGTTNTGNVVPSNSNLTIRVELLSWKSVINITGDGKVFKKITKVGEGFDRPGEGSLVKVMYIGKLEDGTIFERKGSDEEPYEFLTLEENINEGLDRAIMTMKKGEQAIVTVNEEYLCSREVSEFVAANSVLYYEVHLIDFTKEKPFWKMESKEKIEACERKKHDGNLLFRAGKFWRASKKYEKAAKIVEFDHSFTDDEKHTANDLRLSCYLNNAACKLKLEEYSEASRLCTKVIELDPSNVKALFRRSQAYMKTSELEKAEADLKRALAIDPNNKDVKLGHKELKEKQRDYAKFQAEIFSAMVSKMG